MNEKEVCHQLVCSSVCDTTSCQNELQIVGQFEELGSSLEVSHSAKGCAHGLDCNLNHAYDLGIEEYISTYKGYVQEFGGDANEYESFHYDVGCSTTLEGIGAAVEVESFVWEIDVSE